MASELFGSISSGMADKLFGSILYFGIGAMIVVILVGVLFYFGVYRKRFDILVKINSERAADKNKIIFDKAAILKDRKGKFKFFRILNLKIDLPIPEFSVIQSSNKGDYLELYRSSEEGLYFLTPSEIDKKVLIKSNGDLVPVANQSNRQIDTDLQYWNTKRKEHNTSMFDVDSLLMKILPYIPHIMGGVILIFILYILMDSLPGILSELSKLTKELQSLKGANNILVQSFMALLK